MTTPSPHKPPPAPKLPEQHDGNVVKEERSRGEVRPDGPGDDTAPVKREKKS